MSNAEEKSKKKRAISKGKSSDTTNLKKSNSLDEMSSNAKLEDFAGVINTNNDSKVALRSGKCGIDRTRERRSWGNTEHQYQFNASIENLESAEFRVVTKKKKSKKRRNSISGQHQSDGNANEFNRVPSPEMRRTTACSVPHSEKSNDSSDVDSVHSLPIDTKRLNQETDENLPISYADIAKNTTSPSDKPKIVAKTTKKVPINETKPQTIVQTSPKLCVSPPDVHNMVNFPTIQHPKQNVNQKVTVTSATTAKLLKNGPKRNNVIPNRTVIGGKVSD